MTIPVYLRNGWSNQPNAVEYDSAADRTIAVDETLDRDAIWTLAVDKITQTSLLLVLTKLLSGWLIVYLWGIPLKSRLLWGFIPYVGLQASAVQFRTVAGWSTGVATGVAIVWTFWHFVRRRRFHLARAWAGAAALPMAALLAIFEWMRRFSADHLIPTSWMLIFVLATLVAAVLFLGFIENPTVAQPGDPGDPDRTETGS